MKAKKLKPEHLDRYYKIEDEYDPEDDQYIKLTFFGWVSGDMGDYMQIQNASGDVEDIDPEIKLIEVTEEEYDRAKARDQYGSISFTAKELKMLLDMFPPFPKMTSYDQQTLINRIGCYLIGAEQAGVL